MKEVDEVVQFLTLEARPDLKHIALKFCLDLTGTDSGRSLLAQNVGVCTALVNLLKDSSTCKTALSILINLSTEQRHADTLLTKVEAPLVARLLDFISKPDLSVCDEACHLLCNLTRWSQCCHIVFNTLKEGPVTVEKLATLLAMQSNTARLDYLALVFENLTQLSEAHKLLMDKERPVVKKLLPFTTFMESEVRRRGIVGAIRNCCFNTEYHEFVLSEDVDVLPRLLLPLAGPEEFDPDEMDALPEDLQYLDSDKQREPCSDIRKMLIETITQLCATKPCREYIRSKKAYLILRELHLSEKDRATQVACENLVDILISDEPQPGMENLKEVDIPAELEEKFNKMADELEKL